eukprot:gnl/MRDRNA2_/MRDRNA2_102735_c0_seq1.p1 gnl/MRDRNA2_/MRDRNA2_102735_c0~~gnl/MRDRNA2_/MRDRNA2_102735_c0_seq1.p1  ORF type:complete len:534 (+),score=124.95 gnl/MRDRNA2_/MRDRNA2_102735_c0_seq1:91-1602(+)
MAALFKVARSKFSSNHGSKPADEPKGSEESVTPANAPAQASPKLGPIQARKTGSESFIKVGGPGFSTLLPAPQNMGTAVSRYPTKTDADSKQVYKMNKAKTPLDPMKFASGGSQASSTSTTSQSKRLSMTNGVKNMGLKVANGVVNLGRSLSRKKTVTNSANLPGEPQDNENSSSIPAPKKDIVVPKAPVVQDFKKKSTGKSTLDADAGRDLRPHTPVADQKQFCEAAFSHTVLLNARKKAESKLEGFKLSKEHEEVIEIMVDAALRAAWDTTMEMQADFLREVSALRDRIRKVEGDSQKLINSVPKGMDLFKGLPNGDAKIEYYDAMKYLSKPCQELVMEITHEKIKMLFAKDPECKARMNENNLEHFDKQLQQQRSAKYEKLKNEKKELQETIVNLEKANVRIAQDLEHYMGRVNTSSMTGGPDSQDRIRRMSEQIAYEQNNTKQMAKAMLEASNKEKAAQEKISKLQQKVDEYEEKLGKKRRSAVPESDKPQRQRRNSLH